MKENETLKINPLPSKTWYWLHLNDSNSEMEWGCAALHGDGRRAGTGI